MIRLYQPSDRDAVYDICVRTADAGEDSRHLYPDTLLMPSIFAGPYVTLEPSLAFVLDDGGPVGYVVGTADTETFVARYRSEWLPGLLPRYPPLTGPPTTPSEQMIALMHDPERMILPSLAAYPAHLHIDLLPSHQGKGHGRALMNRLFAALRERGVPGVHLGMATVNVRARGFYDRLGFEELPVPDPGPVTYLGMRL
jgi:ribosomal protein S18 acetylase RimI-like enzyme